MAQLFCLRPFSRQIRPAGLGLLSGTGPPWAGLITIRPTQPGRTFMFAVGREAACSVCVCMFVCPCVCACVHVFAIGSALLLHGLVLWACFVVHHAGGRLLKSVAGLAITACFYDLFVLLCNEIAGA